jgi:threonine/homoserine/homoserine lactone efflux protein
MAAQLLLSLRKCTTDAEAAVQRRPFVTGIVLTGANPYFLFWWATVGLALATQASEYGAAMLLTFGVVHWLCDLVWLEILSLGGFHGSKAFGVRSQKVISVICAVVLFGFGLKFLYEAGSPILTGLLKVL